MQQSYSNGHMPGSVTVAALRVKAIALFERTARFSAGTSHHACAPTHEFTSNRCTAPNKDDSHYSLEMSLSQFTTNLSNLSNQQYGLSYLISNADLVDMQTLIHAATIHLHRDALETQPQSYQKCVWAANAMTSLIRSLPDNDYDLLYPIIAVRLPASLWARGAEH